jgi:hypothetical protein
MTGLGRVTGPLLPKEEKSSRHSNEYPGEQQEMHGKQSVEPIPTGTCGDLLREV